MKIKYLLIIIITHLSFISINAQTTTSYGENSGTQGNDNSFFGYKAGELNTTSSNTFIGSYSGSINTTGDSNVFVGKNSGKVNTIGRQNFFGGVSSGYKNSTGKQNLFTGYSSGYYNTTGTNNVFLGFQSGFYNTTANHNTYIGMHSGYSNTTGTYNVFSGSMAGRYNEKGNYNVFTGYKSGYKNINSNHNVFIGSSSGFSHISGSNNSFFGNNSGFNNLSGSNNVFIGYKSGFNETGSDKLYIDNSDTLTPLLYGDFSTNQLGINTNTIPAGYALAVKGKIISEEITVKVFPWSDFVFDKSYQLPSLKEVEEHIEKNGHLQDIPSANEVAEKGVNVGKMEALLLQKIEELTLYAIDQEKKIQIQKEINKNLEKRLLQVEYLIKQLSKK